MACIPRADSPISTCAKVWIKTGPHLLAWMPVNNMWTLEWVLPPNILLSIQCGNLPWRRQCIGIYGSHWIAPIPPCPVHQKGFEIDFAIQAWGVTSQHPTAGQPLLVLVSPMILAYIRVYSKFPFLRPFLHLYMSCGVGVGEVAWSLASLHPTCHPKDLLEVKRRIVVTYQETWPSLYKCTVRIGARNSCSTCLNRYHFQATISHLQLRAQS